MKVKVIQKHPGEGQFPMFKKGTPVIMKEGCTHFLGWFACEIDGYETYISDVFVSDGVLNQDYDPTELVQDIGDILEVQHIVYAWLLATNDNGVTGWIPAEAVVMPWL